MFFVVTILANVTPTPDEFKAAKGGRARPAARRLA
jgi:hypothetical protein